MISSINSIKLLQNIEIYSDNLSARIKFVMKFYDLEIYIYNNNIYIYKRHIKDT